MTRKIPAEWGWAAIAGFVYAWDTWMDESLSSGFWAALSGKRSRVLVLFAWGWVTSHLFLKRPARILIRW
jgi:uncharacterized RDD family membrane protein YckC